MSVVALVSTPNTEEAPNSAPRRIVSEVPSIEIDVVHFERDGLAAVPYLWVRQVPPDRFESVVEPDRTIQEVVLLDSGSAGSFYKVRWEVDSPLVLCVLESGGLIMEAHGSTEEWRLTLWFEEQSQASAFQHCCGGANVPLDIRRLSSIAGEYSSSPGSLTESQREILTLALERGYYEEPRSVSQQTLADELGISSNAVGRLLRRGHRNLVREIELE